MLCIPTLRYFVWDKLSMNDLGLVLAELYQLFDNKRPATYATFNAHNRFEHREFMAHFMINNQHYLNLVYQVRDMSSLFSVVQDDLTFLITAGW
jgi:hypothetical protein